MFAGETAIEVFDRFISIMLKLSSSGQMSFSPENGETLMVFSSRIGKLSLNPPSMYACRRSDTRLVLPPYEEVEGTPSLGDRIASSPERMVL